MANKQLTMEKIVVQPMEEVMHDAMIPYAEYVIMERALPCVEDGLKPVQRRILYTMMELGLTPEKPHKKSARIVGDCLGKYHPHGDTSVYDAMVRMAQDFNMRMPLVDGHGNFGSIDGDPAAAMRYTEARMAPLALELLRDLDKETVPFQLNFDDSLKEPQVLPGRYPNLLVNGASGIAVGLATNIPPHNLGEVIDAVMMRLDMPLSSLEQVMTVLPAPDFPGGGELLRTDQIYESYRTGRGRLQLRAKTHIERDKNGKSRIVVDELPYQVNKSTMLEKILKLSEEKRNLFAGISDIRDESDREGCRAVIELKRDCDPYACLQALYKYSDLQVTFGVNLVAIAEGKPQTLGLLEVLDHYIAHQRRVIMKRTRFELDAAERRAHILEGLIKALDDIDLAIKIIRGAKNVSEARAGLMEAFDIDREQAQAILDMRLQRLTGLETLNLQKEFKALQLTIKRLQGILKHDDKLVAVIRTELMEIREKFADARRTKLIEMAVDSRAEAQLKEIEEEAIREDIVVTLSYKGNLRRLSAKTDAMILADNPSENGDNPIRMLECTTLDKLHIFTNLGNFHTLSAGALSESKGKDKGTSVFSLLQGLCDGEEPVDMLLLSEDSGDLLFCTRGGLVKRSAVSDYLIRKSRAQAISLRGDDVVLSVGVIDEEATLLLVSKDGMSIRFEAKDIGATGRVTAGVKGMALGLGDAVVMAEQVRDEGEVLVLTDRGYAKRSLIFDFELQNRNGKGLKIMDFKKNGANGSEIVCALYVREPFDLEAQYKAGERERFNTDEVVIEKRFSKGSVLLLASKDNPIVSGHRV